MNNNLENIIIIKSKDSYKKLLWKVKKNNVMLWRMKKMKNIKNQMVKKKLETLLLESKILKNRNQNLKILKILIFIIRIEKKKFKTLPQNIVYQDIFLIQTRRFILYKVFLLFLKSSSARCTAQFL